MIEVTSLVKNIFYLRMYNLLLTYKALHCAASFCKTHVKKIHFLHSTVKSHWRAKLTKLFLKYVILKNDCIVVLVAFTSLCICNALTTLTSTVGFVYFLTAHTSSKPFCPSFSKSQCDDFDFY